MSQTAYDEVNLMLLLYDLRREQGLRQARSWFLEQFHSKSPEEIARKYPEGSAESNWIKMVVSYWDMVASVTNRRLIADEMFFESNGEIWVVWERIRAFVPAWRRAYSNPHFLSNIEQTCKRFELWRDAKAPGSSARLREVLNK